MATEKFELHGGALLRLCMLMTHYRSPLDFSEARQKEAKTILERWLKACELSSDGPPVELLECYCDDMNTARMIALLHIYRKNDGKKLFASMKFLGFFDHGGDFPSEWKTLPDDTGTPVLQSNTESSATSF